MNQKIKKIAVLGGGESGIGAALLAKKKGIDVFLSDLSSIKSNYKATLIDNNIPFEENTHTTSKIVDADIIIRSPGIPNNAYILECCRDLSKPIWSEIELGYQLMEDVNGHKPKIIAITGTNGKTTTTSLIFAMLQADGFDVGLGGNIGFSFAYLVGYESHEWYVLEISSFQLEDCHLFRPEIAIITNLSNNHLDRYQYNISLYAEAKFKICANQTESDFLIYNMDSEELILEMEKSSNQHFFRAKKMGFSTEGKLGAVAIYQEKSIIIEMGEKNQLKRSFTKLTTDSIKLKGVHNNQNTMVAGITGKLVELRKQKMRDALTNFDSLPHRMENIAIKNGVEFVNDSKATTVNAGFFALDSRTQPTVWIVGGVDKGNDYGMLLDVVKEKVKGIILLGQDVQKITEAFNSLVPILGHVFSMEDAVIIARQNTQPGDCVLLSPCCASFDLFEDYQQRGDAFRLCVEEIEEVLDIEKNNDSIS